MAAKEAQGEWGEGRDNSLPKATGKDRDIRLCLHLMLTIQVASCGPDQCYDGLETTTLGAGKYMV